MGWSHGRVRCQPAGNNEDKAEPCGPTTTLRAQGTKDEWLQKAHSSGLTSASEISPGLEQGCSLTNKEVESQESRIPSHTAPHLCMSHRHFKRVNSHKKPWRAPQGCEEPTPRWEAPVHPSPRESLGRAPLWKSLRKGCTKGSPTEQKLLFPGAAWLRARVLQVWPWPNSISTPWEPLESPARPAGTLGQTPATWVFTSSPSNSGASSSDNHGLRRQSGKLGLSGSERIQCPRRI